MRNKNLVCYNRTNVSEETDVNETSESKECDVCHYWYLSDKGFKIQRL